MPSAFASVSFAFTSAGSASRGSSAVSKNHFHLRQVVRIDHGPAVAAPRPGLALGFPAGSFLVDTSGDQVLALFILHLAGNIVGTLGTELRLIGNTGKCTLCSAIRF